MPTRHLLLTINGVEGACTAAAVLMKHPEASIQFTSPRHLPKALEGLGAFEGTVHVCGVGIAEPVEDLLDALKSLPKPVSVVWYAGTRNEEVGKIAKRFPKAVKVHAKDGATTVEVTAKALGLGDSAQALQLAELTEDENQEPRSEWHRFCRDLVLAANRRFFLFGDDGLNERAIRFLAGLEEKSDALDEAVAQYRKAPDALYPLGSSKAMKALRTQIGRLGPVPEPVLIVGPTGSGKEVMARALHETSGRSGAFVAVNCAVLGGNLMLVEDRLFGHVKGAFTGANAESKGAFEEADRGTLFLDEIGELPAEVQAQLLRVLEDREVRPVGTMKTRQVDVRVVAATHRNLESMAAKGAFREDLLYRLAVLRIKVPPLHERPEDMKSIAAHVAEELARAGYALKLGKRDWDAIREFLWPGNVRQFVNVLKRAAYMAQPVAEILADEEQSTTASDAEDLNPLIHLYCPEHPEQVVPLKEVNRKYLQHVLDVFDGNITRTARALDIAPNTLRKYTGG